MKKAVNAQLRLLPHPCPLCGREVESESTQLFPARLDSVAFSPAVFSARRRPDKLHYRLVQCHHDGLVRSDPILSQSQLEKLYAVSHFTYDQEVELLTQTYLTALQPVLTQLSSQSPILEIGCGNGFMLQALSQQGFTNVWGCEPSAEAIAKAPAFLRKKIQRQTFSAAAFAGQQFECVMMFQTLDHIADVNQFLADCYTVLKPGGFIISYHHDVSAWPVRLLGESHPIIDVEHTQLFDPKTSKAILTKHGFLIQRLTKPQNLISLRHLAFLSPLPTAVKAWLMARRSGWLSRLFDLSVTISLGNICVIGQKPGQVMVPTALRSQLVLNRQQKELRQLIIKWSFSLHLSHLGSCLSAVDIIAAIYDVKKKADEFVLSAGHAAFAWYAVLVQQKLLAKKMVPQLSVHPDREIAHGITVSSGSLGQGLPIAVGKALANRQRQVYCLTTDGEWSEGSMVEALRIAGEQELGNLTIIVNYNGWGAYRQISDVQLKAELQSFQVDLVEVDGHSWSALRRALKSSPLATRPKIVFAYTTVEQIPALHGQAAHYHVLSRQDYSSALKFLQ